MSGHWWRGLVPNTAGYGVWGAPKIVLAWAEPGPAGLSEGPGPLRAGWVCRLGDYGFLVSGVCPLVGEAGPEARAGFLQGRGRARAQGILDPMPQREGAELRRRPSCGQDRV